MCRLINENEDVTITEIAELMDVSRSTAWRALVSLTEKGVIVRIGPDKSGSWKFV